MTQYFGPDYELDVRPSNMENLNSREYLEKIKTAVLQNLERTRHAPSVQMTDVGKGLTEQEEENDAMLDDEEEDGVGMDRRHTTRRWDRTIEKDGELMSDSEDEEMENSLGVRRQGKKRRRNESNFKDTGSGTGSGMATPLGGGLGGSEVASEAGGSKTGSSSGSNTQKNLAALRKEDAAKDSEAEADDQNLAEYDEELEAIRKEAEEGEGTGADDDGDVEMGDNTPQQKPIGFGMDGVKDDEEMVDAAAPATAPVLSPKPAVLIPDKTEAVKPDPSTPAPHVVAIPPAEKPAEKPEPVSALASVIALPRPVESIGGIISIPGLTLAQAAEDAAAAKAIEETSAEREKGPASPKPDAGAEGDKKV